ncbi:MAG: DUF5906 domain-containing protein, partial [Gammaproteobacteria bacterium]
MTIEKLQTILGTHQETLAQLEQERDQLADRKDLSEDKKSSRRVTLSNKIASAQEKIASTEARIETKQKTMRLLEKKEQEEEDKAAEIYDYFCRMLDQEQLYFVLTANCYIEYFPNENKWRNYKPQAITERLPQLQDKRVRELFVQALEDKKRMYRDVANSFRPQPDYVLNKLSTERWLKPQPGEYSEWFDILFYSLGGGKQENIDHLEHVIAWKYLHPEQFLIPCVIIFGEGGVGKNVLIDVVLGNIFGEHQVSVINMEEVTGTFNDLIVGKTAVFIDEAVVDNANMNRLKRVALNPTVNINEKYGPKYVADNTPLYFAGGNDVLGAVRLAGDGSDRRWSIVKVEKTLLEVISDYFEVGADPDKLLAQDSSDEKVKEVFRLRNHGIDEVLKDKNEVAKWLHHIVEKWKDAGCPLGLHGEDYTGLIRAQKGPFEEVCEAIFFDENFTYISGKTLFAVYRNVYDESVPAGKGGIQRNKFLAQVTAWLKRKRLPIEYMENINITKGEQ